MNTKDKIVYKQLTKDDIPAMLAMQEEVINGLANKELLRRNTYETLEVCFNDKSLILGAFIREKFVGFGIMYAAGNDEENLAYLLDGDVDVLQFVNAKLIMVKEPFRGLGIQRELLVAMVKHAEKNGFSGICATVSPFNTYSMRNLELTGFSEIKRVKKYGGMERILYCKMLGN